MSPTLATASCIAAEITARSSASWASSRSGAVAAITSVLVTLAVALDAADLGSAGAELLLKPLEPAIEVVDAIDHRLALRGQARDHQAHRGPQVRRHDLSPFQGGDAANPRLAALHRNVRPQPRQFRRVHEA